MPSTSSSPDPVHRDFRSEVRNWVPGAASVLLDLADEIAKAIEDAAGARAERIVAALKLAAGHPDLLTLEQNTARSDCYARHVLHADPDGRFTILAIVWGAGQHSPVHAHHTWCAYAVRSNVLTETVYQWDAGTATALRLRKVDRRAGYGCYGEAGLEQIHRLGNDTTAPAISIHVYGVDRHDVTSGVNRIVAENKCDLEVK